MRGYKIRKLSLSIMLTLIMAIGIFSTAAFAGEGKPAGGQYYEIRFALPDDLKDSAEEITLPGTVTFSYGTVIAAVPDPEWDGHVFMDWYYDAKLTRPADIYDEIDRDMTLYPSFTNAQNYDDGLQADYISDLDVDPDFEIRIVSYGLTEKEIREQLQVFNKSGTETAEDFVLEPAGRDPDKQDATEQGETPQTYYIVRPAGGSWSRGDLHQVKILDTEKIRFFRNKEEAGRNVTCYNITVHEDDHNNIKLNSNVIFLPAGEVDGVKPGSGLFRAEAADEEISITENDDTGVLTYNGSKSIKAGSCVAVYDGTLKDDGIVDGTVGYYNITEDLGNGEYAYESADFADVIFLPDIIPIRDTGSFEKGEIRITTEQLAAFSSSYEILGLKEDTVVDAGDFLAVYSGSISDPGSMRPVGFGLIRSVEEDEKGLLVRYDVVSENTLLRSTDMYISIDDIEISLTQEEQDALSRKINDQILAGGFGKAVGEYIAGLISNDEAVPQYTDGLKEIKFQWDGGTEVSLAELRELAGDNEIIVGEPEISSRISLAPQHITGQGIGLNVSVATDIRIVINDGDDINIRAAGAFELESGIRLTVSFDPIWKYRYGFIPYIYDMEGKISLCADTYTGAETAVSVMTLDEETGDDGEDTKEKTAAKTVYDADPGELYAELIRNCEESYIRLFEQELVTAGAVYDPYHLVDISIGIEAGAEATPGIMFGTDVACGNTRQISANFTVFEPGSSSSADDLGIQNAAAKAAAYGLTGMRAGFGYDMNGKIVSDEISALDITSETGVYMELYGFGNASFKRTGSKESISETTGSVLLDMGTCTDLEHIVLAADGRTHNMATVEDERSPILSTGNNLTALDFVIGENDIALTVDITDGHSARLPDELYRVKLMDMYTGNIQSINMDDDVSVDNNGRTWKVGDVTYTQYDETNFHVEYRPMGRYFRAASSAEAAKGGFIYDPVTNTVTAVPAGPEADELWGEFTFTWYHGGKSDDRTGLDYSAGFGTDTGAISRTVKVHWDGNSITKWVLYDVYDGSYTELFSGKTRLNGKTVLENLPTEVKIQQENKNYTYNYYRIFETDLEKVKQSRSDWEAVTDRTVFYPNDTTYILQRAKTFVYVTWVYDDQEIVTSNWLGDKLAEPKPAVRYGYDFTGWADVNGKTYVYPPEGGVKLYPQFVVHVHEWDDGVVNVPATCVDTGEMIFTCKKCKEMRAERIPVDPDNHVRTEIRDAKEATCTEEGYTGDTYCSDCGLGLKVGEIIPMIPHTPGEPVKENEIPATCTEEGSYDEVVYCAVCGEELSRTEKITDKTAHIPGGPVKENEIPATCSAEGSYEEAVYCQACGEEISRTVIVIDKLAHTPGEPVKENEISATCSAEGSYDEVFYCQICGEEISRTIAVVDKLPHTPGEPVKENEIPSSCSAEGSYDEVTYCQVCGEEVSRNTYYIEKLDHTPGATLIENEVPATCSAEGSFDEVVYCQVCSEEISRNTYYTDRLEHTPGEAVIENEVTATCAYEGSYDEVVYCQVCGGEISRSTYYTGRLEHTPGEAVTENVIPATCTYAGSYDEVVYCQVCGGEISRNTYYTEMIDHSWEDYTRDPEPVYEMDKEGKYVCTGWKAGAQGKYCTMCGANSEEIRKLLPYIGMIISEEEAEKEKEKEKNKETEKDERITEFTYDDKEILKKYTTVSDLLAGFNLADIKLTDIKKEDIHTLYAYYSSTGKPDANDTCKIAGEFSCIEKADESKKLSDYLSAGGLKVEIKFTPKDKDNFEEVEKISLTIMVYPITE